MEIKQTLLNKFKELYKGKRLLAVQLNGFTHSVFFDSGTKNSSIEQEKATNYMGWGEKKNYPYMTERAHNLLSGFNHNSYQNNPEEIVYLRPEER